MTKKKTVIATETEPEPAEATEPLPASSVDESVIVLNVRSCRACGGNHDGLDGGD